MPNPATTGPYCFPQSGLGNTRRFVAGTLLFGGDAQNYSGSWLCRLTEHVIEISLLGKQRR